MDNSLLDDYTEEQLEAMLKKKIADREADNVKRRVSYETLKNDTINKLGYQALQLQDLMIKFKTESLDELDAIYDLLKEYSERHKDGKGNFQIDNDQYRIIYRNRSIMEFDERSLQAKRHILDFVNSQWKGDDATRELILNLMNGQNGSLDVRDIQKLYAMENRFDNENWRTGLRLLKESYNEKDTKSYVQFKKKQSDGSYQSIILNFPLLDI